MPAFFGGTLAQEAVRLAPQGCILLVEAEV